MTGLQWAAVTTAALWLPASLAAGLLIGRWMSGRKPPVPGGTPEARTTRPSSSPPAPGPHHEFYARAARELRRRP